MVCLNRKFLTRKVLQQSWKSRSRCVPCMSTY
jgi:hypothetical protein